MLDCCTVMPFLTKMRFLNEFSATTLVVFRAVSVLVGAQDASKLLAGARNMNKLSLGFPALA